MDRTAELYRASFSSVVCGVLVRDHRVVGAAPIMRWSIGKTIREVTTWVHSKGGTFEPVKKVTLMEEDELPYQRGK